LSMIVPLHMSISYLLLFNFLSFFRAFFFQLQIYVTAIFFHGQS